MATVETKTNSLLTPSSDALDMHLRELEEECFRLLELVNALRSTPEGGQRETIEGDLYASLIHLNNHVRPAIKEWDRLVDEMPDDDSE